MENEDIHNELDKEDRDLLGQLLHKERLLDYTCVIEYLEKELERIKRRLTHCRNHQALLTLIKSNNWKEFDSSELAPYNEDTYFPFIGTEEEYKALKKKVEKEQIMEKIK